MLLICLLTIGLGTLAVFTVGVAMFVSVAFSADAPRQVVVEMPTAPQTLYAPVSTCHFSTRDLASRRALRNNREAQAAL